MARRQALSTTARGLGYQHQQDRKRALATLRDGQGCFRCALRGRYHPIPRAVADRWPQLLELDHEPSRAVARATGVVSAVGLSFKRCNRRHGAQLGNQIKALRRAARQPARYSRW